MNTTAASEYLVRLDAALRDVPHGVAAEIRAGIAEELASLDPDAASARIAQLGDPADIAREALAAEGRADAAPAAPDPHVPVTRSRGFAIAAALTLSFGGFLVPFAGWAVGAVLVILSGMWFRWEKVVAVLAPVACVVILMLSSLAVYTTGATEVHESSGTGTPPEQVNPLVPNLFDGAHMAILLALLVAIPASGLWLLWRMRGRTAA